MNRLCNADLWVSCPSTPSADSEKKWNDSVLVLSLLGWEHLAAAEQFHLRARAVMTAPSFAAVASQLPLFNSRSWQGWGGKEAKPLMGFYPHVAAEATSLQKLLTRPPPRFLLSSRPRTTAFRRPGIGFAPHRTCRSTARSSPSPEKRPATNKKSIPNPNKLITEH